MRKSFITVFYIVFAIFCTTDIVLAGSYLPTHDEIQKGIYLNYIASDFDNEFEIDVYIYNISDIRGISFDLNIEDKAIKYASSEWNVKNIDDEYIKIVREYPNKVSFAITAKNDNLLDFDQTDSILFIKFKDLDYEYTDISFTNVFIMQKGNMIIDTEEIEMVGGKIFSGRTLPVSGVFKLERYSPLNVFVYGFITIIFFCILVFYKKKSRPF